MFLKPKALLRVRGEELIPGEPPLTPEGEKQLREMVQEHKRINEIAGFFGKSPESVKQKISRLRLVVVVRQIQRRLNTKGRGSPVTDNRHMLTCMRDLCFPDLHFRIH